jgi:hypothetical protein
VGAGKVIRYEVDGKPVTATTINAEYPRVYAVRSDDGPILGYLARSALGRLEAYGRRAAPDTMGAEPLGSYETMHDAIERVVREASSRDEAPEAS